jgi:hypothetical protein
VDIKLLVAVPNLALHADIFLLGRAVSKVSLQTSGCWSFHEMPATTTGLKDALIGF